MHRILQDLRFALRRLVKDRWFTLAAIAALALGIGANSAVFTLVNAVLLRGLPFYRPDRIMWVDTHDARGRNFGVSLQDFEDWRRASRTFAGMTLVQSGNLSISSDERVPESYGGGYISANAFDLIGVKPVLLVTAPGTVTGLVALLPGRICFCGRLLLPDDARTVQCSAESLSQSGAFLLAGVGRPVIAPPSPRTLPRAVWPLQR